MCETTQDRQRGYDSCLENRPSIQNQPSDERVTCSIFQNETCVSEVYVTVDSGCHKRFSDTLHQVYEDVRASYDALSLEPATGMFTRFFLSDIANQLPQLLASDVYQLLSDSACSFVQQPPCNGGDLSILTYHITSPFSPITKHQPLNGRGNIKSAVGQNYGLHYACSLAVNTPHCAARQTRRVLADYSGYLATNSMEIGQHAIRIWLYLNDIDTQYGRFVDARREVFETYGLTRQTHFIASTGIEGRLADPGVIVAMDAIGMSNLSSAQTTFLKAPAHMNPTHEYGVTFERGTRIEFGDRVHYYISGTASINNCGEVVHANDIDAQTLRAVDNINALLMPEGLTVRNLAYAIAYVRNANHYRYVKDALDALIGVEIPKVFVRASICRPSWLVEIEGVAVAEASTPFPSFF